MFDNVCKFLAESFYSDFATWLLNETITRRCWLVGCFLFRA